MRDARQVKKSGERQETKSEESPAMKREGRQKKVIREMCAISLERIPQSASPQSQMSERGYTH